jgi:phage shock protein E
MKTDTKMVNSPKKKEMTRVENPISGRRTGSLMPAKEVAELIKNGAFILDVRPITETKKGMVPGAVNIPLPRLKRHLDEFPYDKTIVTCCGTSDRAAKAKDILEAAGFTVVSGGSFDGIMKMLGTK